MTRYRWVLARKAESFPVTSACQAAGVSRQAFYDWHARWEAGPTVRQQADAEITERLVKAHGDSDGTYGRPRLHAELARQGYCVNHKRVRRLMGGAGLVGVHKPAEQKTTFPAEAPSPVPDLVSRWFKPGRPDLVWCGDITYVPTGEGWLYVASVLDLGSRRLLGYSMADHMRTRLVTDALQMAVDLRGGQGRRDRHARRQGQPIHVRRTQRHAHPAQDVALGRPGRGVLG